MLADEKDLPALRVSVVTCSDTRGIEEDTAGAALESLIRAAGWEVASRSVVIDNVDRIAHEIAAACDQNGADVVITCGGTGLSPRDVTPEATRAVCDREVPGVAEAVRAYSLRKTGRAMLSRAICMQRGNALVINFPGSEKAARECWEAVSGQLEHARRMMLGMGHPRQ